MKASTGIAIAAPSLGPAIVTVFGIDVPVMALCLSVAGLVLARVVAPPPRHKMQYKPRRSSNHAAPRDEAS